MKMPSFDTLEAVWNWSLEDALGWQGFLIWFVGALVIAVGVALWRKKKETVGLGVLFLLALPAVGEDMTRERFIAVSVEKAVQESANTEEVKQLRAKYFMASQGQDQAQMTQLVEQLSAIKQTVSAAATLKAVEDWETIRRAQVATVQPQPISKRELRRIDEANGEKLAQEDEKLWLMRQQVLIEAEKLRLLQQR